MNNIFKRLFHRGWKVEPVRPLPDPPEEVAPEPPEWVIEWNDFLNEIPIGTLVMYLGIKMIVTENYKSYYTNIYNFPRWSDGGFTCEYVDSSGKIRTKEFNDKSASKLITKL
jgi:hypothetical protein